MKIVKLFSVIFLGLYLIGIGLVGMGTVLTFVTPHVLGFLAFISGILMLIWAGMKASCKCGSCSSSSCKTDDRSHLK